MSADKPRLLVIADSLSFHGPKHAEPLDNPQLWANVAASGLGWDVDIFGRTGWTARDAWWALIRDPYLSSVLLPKADVVILAVGSFDQLPVIIPTYLRDGIAYLRPGSLRRATRKAYSLAQRYGVRVTRGSLRVLPQKATDRYLTRCVEAIRQLHPQIQIVGIVPHAHRSRYYGYVQAGHQEAVDAARAWGERLGVPMLDLDEVVSPEVRAGRGNPDGMHWDWPTHHAVGVTAEKLLRSLDLPR